MSHQVGRGNFGGRCPVELPYFGPLQKLRLHSSASISASRAYRINVQDAIRRESELAGSLLNSSSTHIFVCGLKGMEGGVEEAFADVCRAQSIGQRFEIPSVGRTLSDGNLLSMEFSMNEGEDIEHLCRWLMASLVLFQQTAHGEKR